MKVLLGFWDGGSGHISRIARMARFLQLHGYTCAAITTRPEHASVLPSGVSIHLHPELHVDRSQWTPPDYSHVWSHSQRLLALGLGDYSAASKYARSLSRVVESIKPDLVITDYLDFLGPIAKAHGLPLLASVTSTGHVAAPLMGSWRAAEATARSLPQCLETLNRVLVEVGASPVDDVRLVVTGSPQILVAPPVLEGLETANEVAWSSIPMGLAQTAVVSPRSKSVMVYLGEGNGRPVPGYLPALSRLMRRTSCDFLVISTRRFAPYFAGIPNVRVVQHLEKASFQSALAQSRLLISGGGSVSLQAAFAGVPSLILPWTSGEVYSHVFPRLGIGRTPAAYSEKLEWWHDESGPLSSFDVSGHRRIMIGDSEFLSIFGDAMGIEHDRVRDVVASAISAQPESDLARMLEMMTR